MTLNKFNEWIEDLKALPKEIQTLIAVRASLRVLPAVSHFCADDKVVLETYRKILTSTVLAHGRCQLPEETTIRWLTEANEIFQRDREVDELLSDFATKPGAREIVSHGKVTDYEELSSIAVSGTTKAAKVTLASKLIDESYGTDSDFGALAVIALKDAESNALNIAMVPSGSVSGDGPSPFSMSSARDQDLKLTSFDLMATPIWHHRGEPDWLVEACSIKASKLKSGPDWDFWDRWYEGWLNGKQLPIDLQRRVATQIKETDWEAGPEAVAAEIARIEAAYEVEQSAAEVEESALVSLDESRGIGDNNPPSPIDEALETSDATTIIWAAAQELREEAQASETKKSKVVKALSAIVGVFKACGLYAAKKVDLALDTAIVAATKAAVVAGTGWLALNAETVRNLVQAVLDWLPFLG